MNSGIFLQLFTQIKVVLHHRHDRDATRNNVRLSDYYRSSSSTARVPDTMGNYVTIPTSGEIRMSTFRDQAQNSFKIRFKNIISTISRNLQTNTYRYSSTQSQFYREYSFYCKHKCN